MRITVIRGCTRYAKLAARVRKLDVTLNGEPIEAISDLVPNATLGIAGSLSEHDLTFDTALFRSGANTLGLTVPPVPSSGIIYDYLRLELENPGVPPRDD